MGGFFGCTFPRFPVETHAYIKPAPFLRALMVLTLLLYLSIIIAARVAKFAMHE